MQKQSIDNVSVIFIAFQNFENKMKDPNFEYIPKAKTKRVNTNKTTNIIVKNKAFIRLLK